MSILATALLCAASLSHVECTRETAVDVLVLGKADSELQCLMYAPMTLASLAIHAGEGFYWKTECRSSNVGSGVNVG